MNLMLPICKHKPYLTVLYVLFIFLGYFIVYSRVTVNVSDIVLLTLY